MKLLNGFFFFTFEPSLPFVSCREITLLISYILIVTIIEILQTEYPTEWNSEDLRVRKWSPNEKALNYQTNPPCRYNKKCMEKDTCRV